MQKNSGEIFESIQVDPITGRYFVNLTEEIVNELSCYEDTEIKICVEGDEIILAEKED